MIKITLDPKTKAQLETKLAQAISTGKRIVLSTKAAANTFTEELKKETK
jgi:hypothetical protein|tara:strand:- start:1126 stop:1272 length:147 start_codon:yes stop_codon:yes gene_type:complete